MPGTPDDRTVCEATGYELVRFPRYGVWKLFDTTYGVLTSKPHADSPKEDWYRFDLESEGTIYGATQRQAAYAEVLASLRPRLQELNALALRELDEVEPDEEVVSIEAELATRGMEPGWLEAGWRSRHGMAQIAAPRANWFVDIDSVHTLSSLRLKASELLLRLGYTDLDGSHVRSENRNLTCELAEIVSWATLADGSTPSGIRFESRHGSNFECWAVWERCSPGVVHQASEIALDDRDYQEILATFRLNAR